MLESRLKARVKKNYHIVVFFRNNNRIAVKLIVRYKCTYTKGENLNEIVISIFKKLFRNISNFKNKKFIIGGKHFEF